MVKPALAFLDVIRDIRNSSNLPLCAYNVSGEYAMLKHAGNAGLIDYERVMMETLIQQIDLKLLKSHWKMKKKVQIF